MMKSKIDFCLIQWLNREFLPEDYIYKWTKKVYNTLIYSIYEIYVVRKDGKNDFFEKL